MLGKVYLVGAGPGDYKLLTLKGLECIKKADVLIYDRLINLDYLNLTKETCHHIYVGKSAHVHALSQGEINQLIVEKAKEGQVVTRLKGGDPYVFGRGGEEGEVLYEAGIDFEVIPGVTSAIGGLCYAGIPITHRDHASSFHVVTGHLRVGGEVENDLNWEALAQVQGTLVFLMGVKNLAQISAQLIKANKAKETPVALVSWATRSNQRVIEATLETVVEVAHRERVEAPTLIVVGSVVNLREKLNFFEQKPLFGKNIVVTRASKQNSRMIEQIRDLGGNAIEVPTIKVEPLSDQRLLKQEIRQLKNYHYLVFTSANGVAIFFKTLEELGLDGRHLAHLKIAVIGPQTAKVLAGSGIRADIMPQVHTLEGLGEVLATLVKPSDCLLMPKAKKTRSVLKDLLNDQLKEVIVYETVMDESRREVMLQLLDTGEVDYLTFTSASTVNHFIQLIGANNLNQLKDTKIISIGPITSQALQEVNLAVYKEAERATIAAMIETIEKDEELSKTC